MMKFSQFALFSGILLMSSTLSASESPLIDEAERAVEELKANLAARYYEELQVYDLHGIAVEDAIRRGLITDASQADELIYSELALTLRDIAGTYDLRREPDAEARRALEVGRELAKRIQQATQRHQPENLSSQFLRRNMRVHHSKISKVWHHKEGEHVSDGGHLEKVEGDEDVKRDENVERNESVENKEDAWIDLVSRKRLHTKVTKKEAALIDRYEGLANRLRQADMSDALRRLLEMRAERQREEELELARKEREALDKIVAALRATVQHESGHMGDDFRNALEIEIAEMLALLEYDPEAEARQAAEEMLNNSNVSARLIRSALRDGQGLDHVDLNELLDLNQNREITIRFKEEFENFRGEEVRQQY